MAGFIKIERDMIDSFVFKNDRAWWMWCKLKFLEAFEDGEIRIGRSHVKVAYKKGQIASRLSDLCRELQISHKPLRKFLNDLAEDGLILLDVQPKYTIITFINNAEKSGKNTSKSKQKKGSQKSALQPTLQTTLQPKVQSKLQPTHIIEEIEEDKEKKKIINSSSTTREEEIEFLKNLENDVAYFESLAMLHHINMDILKNLFQHFKKYCLEERGPHRDYADCRIHFKSWLVSDYAKKLINNNGTGQKTEDKYAARRGTAPGSHTQEDYGGKF